MNKSAIIGIFIIAIMFGSTFAYGILQSVRSPVEVPKSNIIEYRLDPRLRYAFVNGGATILSFDYNFECENCYEQKNFLESMANEYKEQIFLEEILNETLTKSKLIVESKLGNKTFYNPSENETFDAICDLMLAPPTICVAR
ncbi:hypothetical protein HZB88_02680 [archaeon]|nr:hypothetical protein [archaeon]